jgi:hypothetical protein
VSNKKSQKKMPLSVQGICVFLVVLFFGPLYLSAQEAEPDTEQSAPDSKVFVIQNIDFEITGQTRPFALLYNGEIKKGEILYGSANLDKYIKDKTQLLINQRSLEEARIEYSLGDPDESGNIPVNLLIITRDTWNIIAIPRPQYDPNMGSLGWDITIKARDYNFLGSMNPLRVDFGYSHDNHDSNNVKNSFKAEIDSNTPFSLFGLNWNLNFDHFFDYTFDYPFYYKNITGLAMELPIRLTTITFNTEHSINVFEKNDERYWPVSGKYFDGVYNAVDFSASWKIPTGLQVYDYGELTYTPSIALNTPYNFPRWPLDDIRKGPFIPISQILGFNKVDWIQNYRKGFDVSFVSTNTYNFFKNDWNHNLSFSSAGHFIITDFFGISARVQYRHWFYDEPEDYAGAGNALRGILDSHIYANYMLSTNLDLPFRLFIFLPSQWLKNSKLKFFDFEFHVSPILDLALYHDPKTDTPFNFQNMLVTGGAEFIVFPYFMRSLYLRFSVAWNLREAVKSKTFFPDGPNREFSLMIGHHY